MALSTLTYCSAYFFPSNLDVSGTGFGRLAVCKGSGQMRRKAKLTIETERVWIVRGGEYQRMHRCEVCGEIVRLVTVDEAEKLTPFGSRAIYRLIEDEKIHFIETGDKRLLICFNSIRRSLSQTDMCPSYVSLSLEDDES